MASSSLGFRYPDPTAYSFCLSCGLGTPFFSSSSLPGSNYTGKARNEVLYWRTMACLSRQTIMRKTYGVNKVEGWLQPLQKGLICDPIFSLQLMEVLCEPSFHTTMTIGGQTVVPLMKWTIGSPIFAFLEMVWPSEMNCRTSEAPIWQVFSIWPVWESWHFGIISFVKGHYVITVLRTMRC
jgi:hypothetical protein